MPWLPTLFAAEAIPSAMITFVALLMFLQLGVGWESSTLLCALLTLPWVMKSFVRARIRQTGHFQLQLKFVECGICLLLIALAFCFTETSYSRQLVFACLFLLCLLCAHHELAARMYYEHMLRPRRQRYYNSWKMLFSQSTTVLTYGVMIVGVGFLEIFYHNRRNAMPLSWSMAVYVLAGIYMLLVVYNLCALRAPQFSPATASSSLLAAMRAEVRVIDRIAQKPHWWVVVLGLFLLLLPQALLFHTRVLFFIGSRAQGGLGASLQWIGLAQGTVGVIAFSAALALGHWRQTPRVAAFLLGLSPAVYWLLSILLPDDLLSLCIATLVAQFCLGYGLNATLPFVRYISGERYRSTINYLYIPLVSMVMLLPMAASGWLVTRLGFHDFFLADTLLALPAWTAAYVAMRQIGESSAGGAVSSESSHHRISN